MIRKVVVLAATPAVDFFLAALVGHASGADKAHVKVMQRVAPGMMMAVWVRGSRRRWSPQSRRRRQSRSEMATGASNQWLKMLCVSFFASTNKE